jgi:uncharacterized membrane protein
MSVVNGDLLDEGLQSVMGKDRCQNEWKPSKKPMVEPFTRPAEEEKKARKTIETAVDASWAPAKDSNWMDNLKSCAKSVILFGGLSFLIFYWKEAGLMAESIAVPAIAVCTALAGYGAGRTVRRGGR